MRCGDFKKEVSARAVCGGPLCNVKCRFACAIMKLETEGTSSASGIALEVHTSALPAPMNEYEDAPDWDDGLLYEKGDDADGMC